MFGRFNIRHLKLAREDFLYETKFLGYEDSLREFIWLYVTGCYDYIWKE